jgi:hypothetical protein
MNRKVTRQLPVTQMDQWFASLPVSLCLRCRNTRPSAGIAQPRGNPIDGQGQRSGEVFGR